MSEKQAVIRFAPPQQFGFMPTQHKVWIKYEDDVLKLYCNAIRDSIFFNKQHEIEIHGWITEVNRVYDFDNIESTVSIPVKDGNQRPEILLEMLREISRNCGGRMEPAEYARRCLALYEP